MSHNKTSYPVSKPHDLGYKSLLSHKQICLDFLYSFVNADWVKDIDEDCLMEVSGHFVTPIFESKETDKIYRLRLQDKDIYFYVLLELQSTVDFLMPYRLLSYMVELWRQVIKKASRKEFRLPAIIPIVLYNGEYKWTALRNFKEMLDGYEYFEDIVADIPYLLIDASDGIKTFETMPYNAFKDWFSYIVCKNLPKEVIEEFLIILEKSSPKEVDIMISNLAETIKKAQENARHKGVEEGLEQSIEQGVQKGVKIGIEQVAKNMIGRNLPLDAIADITELSLKKILKLADELKGNIH